MTARRASDASLDRAPLVARAEFFGLPAWRCGSAGEFGQHLRHALGLDVPSLIVLPIGYPIDVAISNELAEETVIRT
jgi:acetolactate synthase-1/2/3 large subunit